MIFIENKYSKYYYLIINNAKSRGLVTRKQATASLGYVERHHIIPQSIGGSNDRSNLVFLTGREHMVVHLLLTKMTTGKAKSKMVKAAFGMSNQESSGQHRYCLTSRNYAYLRELNSIIRSAEFAGSNNPMYGKEITDSHRSNLKAAAKLKAKPSKEAVEARANSNRGQKRSKKQKANLKNAWATREYLKCEHCQGMFSPGMYHRWHGDKCRLNTIL